MTGTTHQMIALLAAYWILLNSPLSVGPVVAVLAIISVMLGALTPDLDHPAANIFRRMIGGRLAHRLFAVFSGGHRHFTHSLLGIIGVYFLVRWGIDSFIQPSFHEQARILLTAFMIGYISHPLADTLTDQGVPWFWPFHWNIQIPPGPEELRVTTGSFVEMMLLRGALVVAAFFLLTSHWNILQTFFS